MILKRLKTLQCVRMGRVIGGLAAFRQASLARQPRHQVAKSDGGHACFFQKLERDFVSHSLVTPPRGKESPGCGVIATDEDAGRGIAASPCGHGDGRKGGKRRIVACLL